MAIILFILALIGGTAIGVFSSILNGWVLTHLWYWFVYPLGVRPLGLAQAIGFAMIVRYLTHQNVATPPDEKGLYGIVCALLRAFVSPILMLIIGAIVKAFM